MLFTVLPTSYSISVRSDALDFLDVMIVVQAHSDDFDLALSGQALRAQQLGWVLAVVTVTDCGAATGHYQYAVEQGVIQPDGQNNSLAISPDGAAFSRPFYSHNLGIFRLNKMEERYEAYGISTIYPTTSIPDGISTAPAYVQNSYFTTAEVELRDKIQAYIYDLSNATGKKLNVVFLIHSPNVAEHGDHSFSSVLGEHIFSKIKSCDSKTLKRFYVYPIYPYERTGFDIVDVSSVYDLKLQLVEIVWEVGDPELNDLLKSWHRHPWSGDDYWFSHEIVDSVYSFTKQSTPTLADFSLLFATNYVRVLYPSDNSSKPLSCGAASVSDWTASMAVSSKLADFMEGLDTDEVFVEQDSGKPIGADGTGIVTFGGLFVNLVVKYSESDSTPLWNRAPIRFHNDDDIFYFQHCNGTDIPSANLPVSVINHGEDMFVIEVYKDGDGNYMMICYGFGWKGTYAAGKYFDKVIYSDLVSHTESWTIVKWVDANSNGFVNYPFEGDTYTVIALG